jgi:hypothetical protein
VYVRLVQDEERIKLNYEEVVYDAETDVEFVKN